MGQTQPDPVPRGADSPIISVDGEVPRRARPRSRRSTNGGKVLAADDRRLALPSILPLRHGDEDGETENVPPPGVATAAASYAIGPDDLRRINTRAGLVELLRQKRVRVDQALNTLHYQEELEGLQVELVKMQRWVVAKKRRVAILFEGRDAAGKGGAIRRFTEHLNPRAVRVVALPAPTDQEQGQWYFQRYSRQLPDAGEIVFFDRSWYNRAVVEPVNGFCSDDQYQRFMQHVAEYEHMLHEDGVTIVKFWFSISKEEQLRRFKSRKKNLLKQWKLSPIDGKAQALWDAYTRYKKEMFSRTHTSFSPWIIVRANDKQQARLESIRYLLSLLPYAGKESATVNVPPDPDVVSRYHRAAANLD